MKVENITIIAKLDDAYCLIPVLNESLFLQAVELLQNSSETIKAYKIPEQNIDLINLSTMIKPEV